MECGNAPSNYSWISAQSGLKMYKFLNKKGRYLQRVHKLKASCYRAAKAIAASMQTPAPDSQDVDDVEIDARDKAWMADTILTGRLKYMGLEEEEAPDTVESTDLNK
jgi:hypothetical protein